MANFDAVTSSNCPEVKKENIAEVNTILSKYSVRCDVSVYVDNRGFLNVYGYDWLYTVKNPTSEDEEECDDDCSFDLFKEIAPLLKNQLVVQMVGSEKCRFPLSAIEWIFKPDGDVIENHFTCGEVV
jgi:hypothetical protein